MRTRMLLATVMTLTVTACSTSNDATPTTTAAPTTTRASTTTSTTATVPRTTTSTTAVPPTTTESAPPTSAELADETQEVIDAYQMAWTTFNEVKQSPMTEELLGLARGWRTGVSLETLESRIDQYRTEGLRSATNPVAPARSDVIIETFSLEGDVAKFTVCDLDSNLLVEVGAAPDGSDAVVNDEVVAQLLDVEMRLTDGVWKQAAATVVAEFYDQVDCAES